MGRSSGGEAEKELYREIRRAIAERRLMPGIKLTEDSLASLFDVSRARVRKVLLVLAKENIVKQEPNRGAFVWRPTVREARNILDSRRLVEDYLVQEAAKYAKPQQILELRQILADEDQARKDADTARTMRLSGEFHLKLGECAQNPVLSDFLNSLVSQCYLILAVYQRRDGHTCCPQDDHSNIVDLVEKGDGDAAATHLAIHFDHIEAELDLVEEGVPDKPDLKDILQRRG